MKHDLCRIAHCEAPAVSNSLVTAAGEMIEWQCFCANHEDDLALSPERARIHARYQAGTLDQQQLVAALVDFRARVELEHQRDHDPAVLEARGAAPAPIAFARGCTWCGREEVPLAEFVDDASTVRVCSACASMRKPKER